MEFEKELDIYLRARFTLLVLITREEERAIEKIKSVCQKRNRPISTWDCADGFISHDQNGAALTATKDPINALHDIEKAENDGVYVLLDFHECWTMLGVKRKLRSLAERLRFTRKTIIVTAPLKVIPDELLNVAVVIEMALPDKNELNQVLDTIVKVPGAQINLDQNCKSDLIESARGLTLAQAQRAFAKALVKDGKLDSSDVALILEEKKSIVKQSQALEYYGQGSDLSHVGGLEVLKEWLKLRAKAFSEKARDYGINPPKGVALIGIPGTGKSLCAKVIASAWNMPLIRFDAGALYRPYIGQSEETVRSALALADAVSPCVLWIDEIEKGLSTGDHDSGTSTRVFGTILTWMQEKKSNCFVVATANNVSKLPPELLRRGRFDEIFFLDLPTLEERREIFKVHIKKRKREVEKYDLEALATESHGYVGAEIEQAIVDAMVVAFSQDREFTTEDIVNTLKRQVPLSITQRETIESLQAWLNDGRAQSASLHGTGEQEREKLRRNLGFH